MIKSELLEKTIVKNYPEATIRGSLCDIDAVCSHSKEANSTMLFVCLRGSKCDGHEYVHEAYRNGCRIFLCEKSLTLPQDACVIKVKNIREHLYAFLSELYGIKRDDFTFVAITGTKGKTTTAHMLYHILKRKGYAVACSSTLGLYYDEKCEDTHNTTPDIFVLTKWLSKMKDKKIRYIIIEVSSAALSGARIYGMHFDIGILTSFSRDHIGRGEHASMAEYLCAKKSLFSLYGIQTAILPEGIYRGEFIVSDTEKIIILPREENEISKVKENGKGQAFEYKGYNINLSLIGAHNRTNARLAFSAASIITGEREDAFYSCLEDCTVQGRLEQIMHKGVRVIIDYAHNRESFLAVAASVKTDKNGKMICVFGSVGERGEERRTSLAKTACEEMDYSVITEDDCGKESPLHICAEIYAAFPEKTRGCIITDRAEAIRYAFSICKKGDTLLLLGKGHEHFIKRGDSWHPFSEREIVLSL